MPVTIVAGVQWGDEGKGRVVDLLARDADVVVRCQGGPNAGHTVINDRGKFILHSIPSGIFWDRAHCTIGAGAVVSPEGLMQEIRELMDAGIDVSRLLISERAHLIMPYHRMLERLDEESRSNGSRVAPTGRGIAPAYADKAARRGLRAGDLLDMAAFKTRLQEELEWKNKLFSLYGQPPMELREVLAEVEPAADFLRPFIGDTTLPLFEALDKNKRIILEGQLGVMRDLDWGVYPFVTSSSPTPAGMAAGAGISPTSIDRVIGVVKAYTTAVGTGPFPTELTGPDGDMLRERGGEYGATTGRPRRCGWLDMVAVRWAVQLAGFTELVLTKVDVLDGVDTLPVCAAYQDGEAVLKSFPATSSMQRVAPAYEQMQGWQKETRSVRSMEELSLQARVYIEMIERCAGVPVGMVSVGPERDSIVIREDSMGIRV